MSCCKNNGQDAGLPRAALSADAVLNLASALRVGLTNISLPELAELVVQLVEENARLRRLLRPQPEPGPPPKSLPNQLPLPFSG